MARAPLRLSLAGGGSDLPEYYRKHGCHLLAAALDGYVEVELTEFGGGVAVLDEGLPARVARTADLPWSLVRCAMERFGIEEGVRVRVRSWWPSGTGLGWSGALTVALVGALAAWSGHPLSAERAAEVAFDLERIRFGRPIGQQDQWASALGGVLRLIISQEGVVRAYREPVLEEALADMLEVSLLLFRTPIRRDASTVLATQVRELTREPGQGCAEQAMAVITGLVGPFEAALRERQVAELGELLDTHWQAKVTASPLASDPRISEWYRVARAAGAYGGKIVGAGGGGHLLVACDESQAAEVTAALCHAGLVRALARLDLIGLQVQSGTGRPAQVRGEG